MNMATGRMEFYADSIQAHTNFSFVLPNDLTEQDFLGNRNYKRKTKTMILLHGFTGTDTDWIFGGMGQQIALDYNLAVITPTTGNNFYLNRDWRGGKYADYIALELPEYLHKSFNLNIDPDDLLIGGFSMGGFGAIHSILAYPNRFSGAIALSSALIFDDVRKMKEGDRNFLADYGYYCEVFGDVAHIEESDLNLKNLLERKIEEGKTIPSLYMAIGTEDALLEENRAYRDFFERKLSSFKYEEGPGKHNWAFWNNYIFRGTEWILRNMEKE